jgi:hypothetical protein
MPSQCSVVAKGGGDEFSNLDFIQPSADAVDAPEEEREPFDDLRPLMVPCAGHPRSLRGARVG